MAIQQEFFVGIQDLGSGNGLSNKAFIEALSNSATVHAAKVGQGMEADSRRKYAWVVLNWKLQVISRPKACENFTVRTWSQSFSHAFGLRDFEVFDQNGALCARATSRWAAIDLSTGEMLKLTPDMMEGYDSDDSCLVMPGFKFKRLKTSAPVAAEMTFAIPRMMIDCNNHVHNSSYLDLAYEVIPESVDMSQFNDVEVAYRKEIPPHATVRMRYVPDNGVHYVFVESEDGKTLHAEMALR